MALVSQSIHSLLDGISQQPQASRQSSQGDIQENALSHYVRGLRRRPPTQQIAKISTSTTGYGSAFVHEVKKTPTDRYYVVIVGGDLKVFDALTGTEATVTFPGGKSYLTSTAGFRAFTIGNSTYIVNRDTIVKRGTKKAPVPVYEALLFVRQADFSTQYTVTLNGATVTTTTLDGGTSTSRGDIATDILALRIMTNLMATKQLNADFDFTLLGSSIYLTRKNGKDFTLATSDGLADKGLRVVKSTIQSFADLPARAKNGMVIGITGDPESGKDDFWVKYSDSDQPGNMGVWQECPAPGSPLNVDATTMPWVVTRSGALLTNIQQSQAPGGPALSVETNTTGTGATGDGTDTFSGADDITLTLDGDYVTAAIVGTGTGTRQLRAVFNVDTMSISTPETVTVALSVDIGSGFITVGNNVYKSGTKISNDSIVWNGTIPGGSIAKITMYYGSGVDPESRFRRAAILIHRTGATSGGPGISSIANTAFKMDFGTTTMYPLGAVISMTLGATTGTYTVTGGSISGATLSPLITAYLATLGSIFTFNNSAPGITRFVHTDATPINDNILASVAIPTLTFWSDGQTFTPSAFVGRIISNRSDGSKGTITANTADTITVTALTGGNTNQFKPLDMIDVTGNATDYVFSVASWAERGAGNLDVCPMPSFVDRAINEIFFYQDRLGFTAEEYIILSEAGSSLNFMRRTATQLLDSDVIDIRSTHKDVTSFDVAVEWRGFLLFGSGAGHQFALTGDPVLTPRTVRLDHKSSFPMSGTVRPITMGSRLYFPRSTTSFTQVMNYFLVNDSAGATDLTLSIPEYLTGTPLALVGDAQKEFMAVLTSGASDTLWVHSYHLDGAGTTYQEPSTLQASWSKWTFSGSTIIAIDMTDGVLSLVTVRSDGVYLEKIDLGVLPAATDSHLDRGTTTVPFKYRLSNIFFRDRNELAATQGRLQLNYAWFKYHETTDFTVTVTPNGGAAHVYTYHSAAATSGMFQVPILTRNTTVTIEITNSTAGGCAFSGLDWEGKLTTRARAG